MIILLLILSLFLADVAAAATYQTSKNGKNGAACTVAAPCLTIAESLTKMSAGDTLQIGDGVYDESITYNQLTSGNSDLSRTIIKAINPKAAILRPTISAKDGGNNELGWVVWVYGKSWITFDGLEFDGGSLVNVQDVVFVANDASGPTYPNGITVQNSTVHNCINTCIDLYGTNNKVLNNLVYHARGDPGTSPYQAHGIYIAGSAGMDTSNAIVEHNEVYDVDGVGIHSFHSPVDNLTIRFNYVHDGVPDPLGFSHSGILAANGTGDAIYGNIVTHFGDKGIRLYAGADNAVIYNNTIYNNRNECIHIDNSINATVRNNLCISNDTNGIVTAGSSGGLTFSNNLCSSAGTGCALFEPASTTFINPGTDFHLKLGSAAINPSPPLTGCPTTDITGAPRPQGSSCDIGAYEYNFPAWVAGKYGNGLQFTGVESLVIPDTDSLDLSLFTIEAHFKPSITATNGFRALLSKNDGTKYIYLLSSTDGWCGGGVAAVAIYDSVNIYYACDSTGALVSGTWYHIAGTYDGAILTLYKDGIVVSTVATTVLPMESTAAWIIGNSVYGENSQGTIDEIQVFNYARTQAQIQLDMVTPLP